MIIPQFGRNGKTQFLAGNGIRAKYLMYPIPTNTPAGCYGNMQSRSIGEDGDNAGDSTPRVLLYMNIIPRFTFRDTEYPNFYHL